MCDRAPISTPSVEEIRSDEYPGEQRNDIDAEIRGRDPGIDVHLRNWIEFDVLFDGTEESGQLQTTRKLIAAGCGPTKDGHLNEYESQQSHERTITQGISAQ